MILWSQQINEINNVFFSFQKGERICVPVDKSTQEHDKLFLKPAKFENMTIGNFKIMLYYHMFYKAPTSKIEFLKALNKYTKTEIVESGKLRRDIQSYKFIIDKDFAKLETLNITPYDAYVQNKIHPFTLHSYYQKHADLINSRMMKHDILKVNTLMQHFKIKD